MHVGERGRLTVLEVSALQSRAEAVLGATGFPAVARPTTAADLASTLAAACDLGQAVVPWGGGTQQDIGCPPATCDLLLVTRDLRGISHYAPEDLTVSVATGTTLGELHGALAEHGQFLPLDVPRPEEGTIGGAIATAASSIRRSRYGSARDMVIGMTIALPDGSLCKTGGRVVKNVAGYDLCKLFAGSLGTLGVIVSANFKIFPRPKQTILVHGRFEKSEQAFGAARQLGAASQYYSFVIVEVELSGANPAVYALVEGFSGTLDKQTDTAKSAISQNEGVASVAFGQDAHGQIARRVAMRSPEGDSAVQLRGAVTPRRVDGVYHAVSSTLRRSHGDSVFQADIVTGTFSARLAQAGGDPSALAASIGQLRNSMLELGGHFRIAGGTPELRRLVEAWGAPQSAEALSRTIKARLDPHGILNPGRFAYGI